MGIALMYFYNGFYVIFFTVMFCDFAPKTGRPEFWTGMGRVVRCAFVALAVMPVMRVYETAGSVALVVISCALSITLLLVLLPHIVSALKKEAEGLDILRRTLILESGHKNRGAERLRFACAKYPLT